MIRDYFFAKQREKAKQTVAELRTKNERHLRNTNLNATTYDPIADMRDALRKVQTGKYKNVTINAEYDRLTNSSYKYK